MNRSSNDSDFSHDPVLLNELVALFRDLPKGLYVDATLGGAGHARAVLTANPRLSLLGIDRDITAINAAERNLAEFGDRVTLVHSGYDRIKELVYNHAPEGAQAVLMDLGVSSPQLDTGDRGFSYRHSGPLDMRMDQRQSLSAMEIVNEYSVEELFRVIKRYGEERFASRIAKAIVQHRPIQDTTTLANVIRDAIPHAARRTGGHPAKKTFQALRIETNAELDQLTEALDGAIDALAPGGRIAVMSYHSLEDRLVKQAFRDAETGGCVCPSQYPCVCGAEPTVRLLSRGGITASEEEIRRNNRARSVRMRTAERLGEQAS